MGGSSLGVTCVGMAASILFLAMLHQDVMSEESRIMSLYVPKHAHRYTNQTINCTIDDVSKLYFIKWLHNGVEFLRFLPNSTLHIYNYSNIHVIEEETTGEKVVLKEVDLSASGNYECYVSLGYPTMIEDRMNSNMTVVVVPEEQPTIEGEVADHYAVGDTVNLNCTATPSVPAASLAWFINDNPAPTDYLEDYPVQQHKDGLVVSRLGLTFTLTSEHFINGELKLKCTATIATVLQSVEHSQQNPKDIPVREKPEGSSLVTSTADPTSGASSLLGRSSMVLPHLLCLILTSLHLLR